MSEQRKFILSLVGVAVLGISGTVIYMTNKLSMRSINATKSCSDIFLLKEKSYFPEVTKNRYIYNNTLNTCLMFSQYTDPLNASERYVVIDMVKDEPIFIYLLPGDKETDDVLHLTKDQALERIRVLGFYIF